MHQEQERARLSRIIDRIEDYQAVEVPNEECAKVHNYFTHSRCTCSSTISLSVTFRLVLYGSFKSYILPIVVDTGSQQVRLDMSCAGLWSTSETPFTQRVFVSTEGNYSWKGMSLREIR